MKKHFAVAKLEVKSATEDGDKRTITGMATTPTPDRMGDIVEPMGAEFKTPLPLLWQHNSDKPIGHVTKLKKTKDGIEFTATIAKSDEPGTLKDRLDEAWQSIKMKLVSGVSIGFTALKGGLEWMQEGGGYRFTKWEMLELSVVTIPANPDAGISELKTFNRDLRENRAASGRIKATKPGASGTRDNANGGNSPMWTKKIEDKQKELGPMRDRRDAIRADLEKRGVEPNEDEADEINELSDAIEEGDRQIKTWQRLAGVGGTAIAVKGTSAREGAQSRGGIGHNGGPTLHAQAKKPEHKGIGFARVVMCAVAAKGNMREALEIATDVYGQSDPLVSEVLKSRVGLKTKAQVAGADSQDPSWAAPLMGDPQNLVNEFIEYLTPMTIVGKFGQNGIPDFDRVPFNIKVAAQSSAGEGYWVGEGKAKPVTRANFTSVTMRFNKVANIAVMSDELLRFNNLNAELRVRNMLAQALLIRLDADLFDPAVSLTAEIRPASLTNGAQSYASGGDDTAAGIRADLKLLFTYFITNNIDPSGIVLVMRSTQALALSLMRNAMGVKEFPDITMAGGFLEGFPVIASQHVKACIVAAVAAPEVFLADDGGVAIDASREASIEMASDPTMAITDYASPPASTEVTTVSMWQTNSVALRAERVITWLRRRSTASVYLTGVSWGAPASSPPASDV